MYREHEGTSERALFVIDPEGVIRWSYLSPAEITGFPSTCSAAASIRAKRMSRDQKRRWPVGVRGVEKNRTSSSGIRTVTVTQTENSSPGVSVGE